METGIGQTRLVRNAYFDIITGPDFMAIIEHCFMGRVKERGSYGFGLRNQSLKVIDCCLEKSLDCFETGFVGLFGFDLSEASNFDSACSDSFYCQISETKTPVNYNC